MKHTDVVIGGLSAKHNSTCKSISVGSSLSESGRIGPRQLISLIPFPTRKQEEDGARKFEKKKTPGKNVNTR